VRSGILKHRRRDPGHVGSRDERRATMARRAAQDPVVADEVRQEVLVEVVAEEGVCDAARLDELFRRVVVPAERERRLR
jgi:hypothetical protein